MIKPVRFYNWNYAGLPLFLGFIGGPGVASLYFYLWANGRINAARPDEDNGLGLGIALILIATGLFLYALLGPVIWFELGEEISYRTIARQWTRPWTDVKRIWFDTKDTEMDICLMPVKLGTHHLLLIDFDNYNSLSVYVCKSQRDVLEPVLKICPEFRNWPPELD